MLKKNYYVEKFEMAKGNIRKLLLTINHMVNGPDLPDKNLINEMKINNKLATYSMTIANEFNKFFTNIEPNLANNISNVDGDISDYLNGSFQNSMCAIHTDPIEIQNITNHLRSSSSKGVDDVSSKIVKEVIEAIAQPLATVVNISLADRLFQDKLKIAKIIPVYI